MNLVRIASLALAVLLPTAWTVAKAADEPPAGDTDTTTKPKSSKKSKKSSSKKSDGSTKTDKGDTKPDSDSTK